MSVSPIQKLGTLAASMASPTAVWSTSPPRLAADRMPTGTPISMAIPTDIMVSSPVSSDRSASACATGRFRKMDSPRSKRMICPR